MFCAKNNSEWQKLNCWVAAIFNIWSGFLNKNYYLRPYHMWRFDVGRCPGKQEVQEGTVGDSLSERWAVTHVVH